MTDCEQNCAELLDEIERLKMMLDAAAAGQETMQKQWAADVAERDAAVADLKVAEDCCTCVYGEEELCNPNAEDGTCGFVWRGVQK